MITSADNAIVVETCPWSAGCHRPIPNRVETFMGMEAIAEVGEAIHIKERTSVFPTIIASNEELLCIISSLPSCLG